MAIKTASTSISAGDKAKTKSVGIAFADTSKRQLGVSDFVDNDLFSNTEVHSPTSVPLLYPAYNIPSPW
jgi:DNA mismatch repair protein MSH2